MPSLLRSRAAGSEVTNGELFFDLVYVFAVTQISHRLLEHPTVHGALDSALLLAMVWICWAYTTWVTNWLDPDRVPTRTMLMIVMLGSLVLAAGLPEAFGSRGLWVGAAYAGMQVGRSAYTVWAIRADASLQSNYVRILMWCTVSGALAVAGGIEHGHVRELLWLLAVGVDGLGGSVGFWTPVLGRSRSAEWTIDGGHFAERCQAFLLIALGESIVAIGASFAADEDRHAVQVLSFLGAFAAAVGLWWLYFDRRAADGMRAITTSDDPGRLAAGAYHFVHPIMIAGIIVTAAGNEAVLRDPAERATGATAWFVAGGTALFLLGHGLYTYLVTGQPPLVQGAAAAVLIVLAVIGPELPALAVGLCTLVIIVVTTLLDLRGAQRPASLPAG